MSDELKLIEPTAALEESYRSYVAEARAADELLVPWVLGFDADDFPALLARLSDASDGKGLCENLVPHTTYWTVDAAGDEIIGVANLRHRLNDFLLREGGHIGYSIRPSFRGRGLATRQLALALETARRRGLRRVLVVCECDNAASGRVIQKNGGRMADEVTSEETGKLMRRYWIEL
jgi:predicted acetyltransferase